jgi:hypothetical protein
LLHPLIPLLGHDNFSKNWVLNDLSRNNNAWKKRKNNKKEKKNIHFQKNVKVRVSQSKKQKQKQKQKDRIQTTSFSHFSKCWLKSSSQKTFDTRTQSKFKSLKRSLNSKLCLNWNFKADLHCNMNKIISICVFPLISVGNNKCQIMCSFLLSLKQIDQNIESSRTFIILIKIKHVIQTWSLVF